MAVIKELLRSETDGTISFGDYELDAKKKLADYEHQGDIYKVKTFKDITKLERNDLFVYESVPGTAVTGFSATGSDVCFAVEGAEDVQITLGMMDDTSYEVILDGECAGKITTGLGGKLSFSIELEKAESVKVEVHRAE